MHLPLHLLYQACNTAPGFVYLALGDPLQKRNDYHAGWIKFTEDADIPTTMGELSEKKVGNLFRRPSEIYHLDFFLPRSKVPSLHLSHTLKPFTNRIRYAPEVVDMPDRLAKDLASAKTLASLLEDEYDRIRRPPLREEAPSQKDSSDPAVQSAPTDDTLMVTNNLDQGLDEDAPKSRGNEAVERHIEELIPTSKRVVPWT